MTSVSDTERSEWGSFAITGQALRCEAEWGVAGVARSVGTGVDPAAAAIDATDGMQTSRDDDDLGTGANRRRNPQRRGGRCPAGPPGAPRPRRAAAGAGRGAGPVHVDPPGTGRERGRIPVETTPGTGGFPGPLRRVLRIVGVKTVGRVVGHASNTLVGGWDERHHPHRLRTWTRDDHRDPEVGCPDIYALLGGPALLVVHGFTGSIHGSFAFESDVVHAFQQAYAGRTLAFDHPTLATSPLENARWVEERLTEGMVRDVLAHSRGGLVARKLAQVARSRGVTVRSITFVATPNDGTPLGDPDRPMGLVDALTNLVGALPGSDVLEMVLELFKDVVLKFALEDLRWLVPAGPAKRYEAVVERLGKAAETIPGG